MKADGKLAGIREWWVVDAWPWLRDIAIPAICDGCAAWFEQTMESPGVAAINIILGAVLAACVQYL